MARIYDVARPMSSNANHGTLDGTMVRVWTPIFPLLCSLFGLLAMISGYLIAVFNNHAQPWLPLISEGGSIPPESNIFGTLLNLAAFFWWITCFCIHAQLLQHIRIHRSARSKLRYLFYFMLLAGIISGLGLLLVANFQLSNIRSVHGKGALSGFFGGMVFAWCYVILLACLRPRWIPRWLWILRVILVIIVSASVIMHELCMHLPLFVARLPDGTIPPHPITPSNGILRLEPCDPYYNNKIIACIAEWILGLGYFIVVATIACDLRWFRIDTSRREDVMDVEGIPDSTVVSTMVDSDPDTAAQYKL